MAERVQRHESGSGLTPAVPLSRVQRVVSRVVIRALRNPDGLRQVQEGAGPFQRSTTYGGDEPGEVYLTDKDRDDLGGVIRGGAFTIDTTPTSTRLDGIPESWLSPTW